MIFHAGIAIYKANEFFIVTDVKRPKGGWFTYAISESFEENISDAILGQECLSSLQVSENSPSVEKGFEFWRTLGYKTYSTFSKKFESVDIVKLDDKFRVMLWIRDRGGYIPSKDPNHTIDLPLDVSPIELAQAVKSLFAYVTAEPEEPLTIETASDNLFTYSLPTGSEFEDLGDGHTDAYQIFSSTDYPNSTIAFMIDSGYAGFSETDMKEGFERHYGPLLEYAYKACRGKAYKFKVTGKTETSEIVSYLFPDGEDWMEVIYVIDQRIPKRKISQLRKEFEAVVKSIRTK